VLFRNRHFSGGVAGLGFRRRGVPQSADGFSSARRNAEAVLDRAQKREASFKLGSGTRMRGHGAETARLRELRLAKEAGDAAAKYPTRLSQSAPSRAEQRADRNRSKAQKKTEKLKRLEEETARRKATRGEESGEPHTQKDAQSE
jgi:hypothetical protein